MKILHSRPAHKRFSGHNLPRRVTSADAPPAAVNRALRREWVAIVNAALKYTGDPDAALRAGAEMLAAALDLDAKIAGLAGRRHGLPVATPLNLPAGAIRLRARGDDDSAIEAILAGAMP